jgi:DNA/RNA-binding domain of Phe-tRNA-synthetase-like protein
MKAEVAGAVVAGSNADGFLDDPVLAGFRRLHDAVGRSNKKNVASPENLLATVMANGRLPTVNVVVDIYNLVSLRTRLALGAHDIGEISGDVHLRLTTGSEGFWPLGSERPKPVGPGEYAYVDDRNDVICRLEVRQVERTKITIDTTECFYIVQGNEATDGPYLKAAADELVELTKRFCGGRERLVNAIGAFE